MSILYRVPTPIQYGMHQQFRSAGASPSRPEYGPWEGEAPADPTHRFSDARANFFSMGIMDLSRTKFCNQIQCGMHLQFRVGGSLPLPSGGRPLGGGGSRRPNASRQRCAGQLLLNGDHGSIPNLVLQPNSMRNAPALQGRREPPPPVVLLSFIATTLDNQGLKRTSAHAKTN